MFGTRNAPMETLTRRRWQGVVPSTALVALFAALALFGAADGWAQDPDWQKVRRTPPSATAYNDVDSHNPEANRWVGIQFGYPGVLSPRALIPVGDRSLVGPGLTLVPDLTGVSLEYRYELLRPRHGSRPGILPGAALSLFDVKDGSRSTTPLALNLFIGMLYRTDSDFAIGGDIGLMQVTGSETDGGVDAYGIHKGLSTAYVSFSVGYFF